MLRPGRLFVLAAFLFFAPSAQAAITASASPKEIKYNQSTTLSGKATPGQTVTLDEKPAGASSFRDPITTTADTSGDYQFADLKPGFNTTYRVRTPVDTPET